MNPDLGRLQPYPFEKLAELKRGVEANHALDPIALSVGEPKHSPPALVLQTLTENVSKVSKYPATQGLPELRQSVCNWLIKRFKLSKNSLCADAHVLPVNGTREALFAFAQAVVDRHSSPLVLMPNPFYQIYEGAALLAGAEPKYLCCREDEAYQPDFDSVSQEEWRRCQLIYLCSPNNPTGSTLSLETYQTLIQLADRYDFTIASDECYSEIYPDDHCPPPGLLEVCRRLGRDDFKRCVVFHSLSKRSNLPGLRSGFVAGDKEIIQAFLRYRTYHGCAMSVPVQLASAAAWGDEDHVRQNRLLYREKFSAFAATLEDVWTLDQPQAGFNFWAKTPIDDEAFTRRLYAEKNITVLPGSYLSRPVNGFNPGKNHVRMAMVAPLNECVEAAQRINQFIKTLSAE
ncbi:MAG: N-succinyldiaminopimelate aminotransferase [Cellvibrionaceae bacterium]|jgi:N-succinyldiaminopimelate aminotransferase